MLSSVILEYAQLCKVGIQSIYTKQLITIGRAAACKYCNNLNCLLYFTVYQNNSLQMLLWTYGKKKKEKKKYFRISQKAKYF